MEQSVKISRKLLLVQNATCLPITLGTGLVSSRLPGAVQAAVYGYGFGFIEMLFPDGFSHPVRSSWEDLFCIPNPRES